MLILTNKTIERLQHDLVREGLINFDTLTVVQNRVLQNNSNLAEELISGNFIPELELLNFIQNKLHIPYIELKDYTPDEECLKYVSKDEAEKYKIFPLFKIENVLTVAMADPLDLFTINNLFKDSELVVEPVVCSEFSISNVIENYYGGDSKKQSNISWDELFLTESLSDDLLEKSIVLLINDAITNNAAYITFETVKSGLNIFFEKQLKGMVPALLLQRFLTALKVKLNFNSDMLDIAQNSKTSYIYDNKDYVILSSIFPAKFYTRIVLNIYEIYKNIENFSIDLTQLNMFCQKPAFIGIKCSIQDYSSVLYAIAEYLSKNKSVILVENNSKYQLSGITQCEFNNTAVYFDEILKQVELQNFDVIFWEKIYTMEQFQKLKLFANEKIIFTQYNENIEEFFDFVIDLSK